MEIDDGFGLDELLAVWVTLNDEDVAGRSERGAFSAREVFAAMPGRINPAVARDMDGTVIQFLLTGSDGGAFALTIKDGAGTVEEGAHPSPHLTVAMTSEDFVAMIEGRLSGEDAHAGGRLRLSGDLHIASSMAALFAGG